MKLSSFTMFFILLIILLISVMFAYVLPEGFISYNTDTNSLGQVAVPPYSSAPIYKIYDSVYFDSTTGNVVELFGTAQGSNNAADSVNSLTNMLVMPETGGSVIQYNKSGTSPFSNNIVESSIVGTPSTNSLNSWLYPNASSLNTLPFNYQVLYFPWNKDVVVVLYDILAKKMVGVYTFIHGGDPLPEYHIPSSVVIPVTYIPDSDPQNDTFTDSAKTLYKIAKNVTFSTTNQTLSFNSSGSTGGAPQISETGTTIASSDVAGGNIILAVPFSGSNRRTLVCVICPDQNNTQLMTIRNVVRFDPSVAGGVVLGGTISTMGSTTATTSPGCTATTAPPGCAATTAPPTATTSPTLNMSDYMLKTQMVPPVCPACPTVNNNISCPGCGKTGTGGGGGGDVSGNTLANIIADAYARQLQAGYNANAPGGANTLGGVANNLVNTAGGLGTGAEAQVGNIVNTAGGLAGKLIDTAGGLAGQTIGTAGGLGTGLERIAGQAVGGAVDLGTGMEKLAEHTVSDVTGLGGRVSGDVTGIVNNGISTIGNIGNRPGGGAGNAGGSYAAGAGYAGSAGTQSTNYSGSNGYITSGTPGFDQRYGAAAETPTTDFIPVTSDFSKFGR